MLAPGDLLGRYELLTPIAKGGMAQVWAARLCGTRGFQKLVAIKTILPIGIEPLRLEQMFLHEAQLASHIHHPNVAHTHELGEQDGALYLVMEWVHGESLRSLLHAAKHQSGVLPTTVAVNLIGQACKGLHAAHDARDAAGNLLGIIHRDVSPHNLLVTYTGTVKVVDFGVAKSEVGQELTRQGEIKGKLAFMSPEQLAGEPLDRRSDIFALGGILYWALVGKHPFLGDSSAATRNNIRTGFQLAPPSASRRGISPTLEVAVMKALAFDREQRWPTAMDFYEALARAEPLAFGPRGESDVAAFLASCFGDRAEQRQRQLQQAQDVVDRGRITQEEPAYVPDVPTSSRREPDPVAIPARSAPRADARLRPWATRSAIALVAASSLAAVVTFWFASTESSPPHATAPTQVLPPSAPAAPPANELGPGPDPGELGPPYGPPEARASESPPPSTLLAPDAGESALLPPLAPPQPPAQAAPPAAQQPPAVAKPHPSPPPARQPTGKPMAPRRPAPRPKRAPKVNIWDPREFGGRQ